MITSVLLIDDTESDLYYHEQIIKKADRNITVFKCHDGKEALSLIETMCRMKGKFQGLPPDVIFLDINMPKIGGLEFLEAFEKLQASNKSLKNQPIVMLSASNSDQDITQSAQYGCVKRYMQKPLTAEKIREILLAPYMYS